MVINYICLLANFWRRDNAFILSKAYKKMNKHAQADWEELIKLIIVLPIILAVIGAVFGVLSSINQQNCPKCETCDYSSYQNDLAKCNAENQNLTNQLNETPIKYVNVSVEVPVEKVIERTVYKDNLTSITIISISTILSIFLTVKLFTIKIELPKELEEKIKKLENWIKTFKWISLAVSLLILIKLLIIFFSF